MGWKRKFQLYTGVRNSPSGWTTDKQSRIDDFYGVLEKIAWIWRISGIFQLTTRASMGIVKYELNKFHAVYSGLICCACVGNIIYGVTRYFSNEEPTSAHETDGIGASDSASILCLIGATIWRIFSHKEISEIINTMAGQDFMLEKMNCSLRYEWASRILSAYVWASSINVALLLTYDYYATRRDYDRVSIQDLLSIFPLVGQIMDQTMFTSLVGLLGLKFRALNEKLIAVVTRVNSSPSKIIVTSDFCAENLRRIAKGHYRACAIGKRINKFFAWEIIINVIVNFTTLNQSLFSIFIEARREANPNLVLIGAYIDQALIRVVPLISIVAICNWTSRQSVDTGKFIHQTRVDKTDSRLYEIVKTFSLQLHHQKLKFTAYDLFPVNSKLIQKTIADVTTYLVFLIQVQTSLDGM